MMTIYEIDGGWSGWSNGVTTPKLKVLFELGLKRRGVVTFSETYVQARREVPSIVNVDSRVPV